MHPAEYLDMQAVKEEKMLLEGKPWGQDMKIVYNVLQVTSILTFFLIWTAFVRQQELALTQATADINKSLQDTVISIYTYFNNLS